MIINMHCKSTGFYMMGTQVVKGLMLLVIPLSPAISSKINNNDSTYSGMACNLNNKNNFKNDQNISEHGSILGQTHCNFCCGKSVLVGKICSFCVFSHSVGTHGNTEQKNTVFKHFLCNICSNNISNRWQMSLKKLIQNPAKHLRSSFLRKQLTVVCKSPSQMFDRESDSNRI